MLIDRKYLRLAAIAAPEPGRYALHALCLERLADGRVTVTATDGKCLITAAVPDESETAAARALPAPPFALGPRLGGLDNTVRPGMWLLPPEALEPAGDPPAPPPEPKGREAVRQAREALARVRAEKPAPFKPAPLPAVPSPRTNPGGSGEPEWLEARAAAIRAREVAITANETGRQAHAQALVAWEAREREAADALEAAKPKPRKPAREFFALDETRVMGVPANDSPGMCAFAYGDARGFYGAREFQYASGHYPPIQDVMPDPAKCRITIRLNPAAVLKAATGLAALAGAEKPDEDTPDPVVCLSPPSDRHAVVLRVAGLDVPGRHVETDGMPDGFRLGLDARLLEDLAAVLRALTDAPADARRLVTLRLKDPHSAMLVELGRDGLDLGHVRAVLMPVNVTG